MPEYKVPIECYLDDAPDGVFDVGIVPQVGHGQKEVLRGIRRGSILNSPYPVAEVHCLAQCGGYWAMSYLDLSGGVSGPIPRLPTGPLAWWHRLHRTGRIDDGHGIRIGVVDEALALEKVDSPIAHVTNIGGAAWDPSASRAHSPLSSHSRSVCGLIASRDFGRSDCYLGVAPGAEIIFAAAGEDDSEYLSVTRLANSIDVLVDEYHCDIISFSAGDCSDPLPEIREAANAAMERGCVCITAAGNLGGSPLYPARYEECLAVGALGKVGLAPANTYERGEEGKSSDDCQGEYYYWSASARGPEVDYVGAGVAVFALEWTGVYSVCGTSFAAPITAGVAAAILARDPGYRSMNLDRNRAKYAVDLLNKHTLPLFGGRCKHGVLVGT